ncbi:MAG: hypothetical protein U9N40_00420 [Euryarchaeota archaeon]|nr:hypothetical protein [Euryarchaeota archaeon]
MLPKETLTLNDTDNLQEKRLTQTRTLRDAGIAVRINQTMELNRSVIATGKIRNFSSYLFTERIIYF